jgi:hypothetical protein
VTFVEVVPVHLVDSHREHLFIVRVDSLRDDSIVEALVDVDSRSVSIVEDEGVPKRLSSEVVSFVVSNNLE